MKTNQAVLDEAQKQFEKGLFNIKDIMMIAALQEAQPEEEQEIKAFINKKVVYNGRLRRYCTRNVTKELRNGTKYTYEFNPSVIERYLQKHVGKEVEILTDMAKDGLKFINTHLDFNLNDEADKKRLIEEFSDKGIELSFC